MWFLLYTSDAFHTAFLKSTHGLVWTDYRFTISCVYQYINQISYRLPCVYMHVDVTHWLNVAFHTIQIIVFLKAMFIHLLFDCDSWGKCFIEIVHLFQWNLQIYINLPGFFFTFKTAIPFQHHTNKTELI